jgi:luciferase family oxidoreductase group 1
VPLPLSVLDLVPRAAGLGAGDALRQSLDLARLADRLGYTRLWYAEHHNAAFLASTAPDLMIALAAPVTRRIRLGAGGVMLPNHAALQVAERYRMLEALAPGRIDLGLGRAPGTDGATAMALRGSAEAVRADTFPHKLAELIAFARDDFPDGHPYRTVRAQPADVPLPPLWILGSSAYGADLAASLGLPYGFAGHFSDLPPELPLRAYREGFVPGVLERPYALLTLAVIVGGDVRRGRPAGGAVRGQRRPGVHGAARGVGRRGRGARLRVQRARAGDRHRLPRARDRRHARRRARADRGAGPADRDAGATR